MSIGLGGFDVDIRIGLFYSSPPCEELSNYAGIHAFPAIERVGGFEPVHTSVPPSDGAVEAGHHVDGHTRLYLRHAGIWKDFGIITPM